MLQHKAMMKFVNECVSIIGYYIFRKSQWGVFPAGHHQTKCILYTDRNTRKSSLCSSRRGRLLA